MGLKKRNKISAEFSMSSLTDIIFLLLIFFMLTSSMVIPNALNLSLPGRSHSNAVPKSKPYEVVIAKNGNFYVNNKRIGAVALERALKKIRRLRKGGKVSIIISPNPNVANEKVVEVMDMAFRLKIEAIMAKPK